LFVIVVLVMPAIISISVTMIAASPWKVLPDMDWAKRGKETQRAGN
jgi:hypothetical protein